jgi:hypothetical protein
MPFLPQGSVASVTIPAGQSIIVGAYRAGFATVTIPAGLRGGPIGLVTDTATTFGPYPAGATVSVQATRNDIEYVVGASPVLTDVPGAAAAAIPSATYGSQIRAAVSAYKRGLRTRPPIIMAIGDSNFVGDGAGTSNTHYVDCFSRGPIAQLPSQVPMLADLPLSTTAWVGEGNMSSSAFAVTVTQYNPKLTLGSGWSRDSSTFGLGGFWMLGGPSTTGYLQYSFGSSVNNVEIYIRTSATDSSSVGVYNSANTLITSFTAVAGAPGVAKITVTSALFTDGIVKLKNNAGSNFRVAGMVAWNSLVPSIIVVNAGYCAAATGQYATTTFAWDGMAFYPLFDPDLTIVGLSINDIIAGTARATYNTNLDYILTRCNDSGDLIVSTCGNGNIANYTNGVSDGIAAEARIVAAKYGAPFVDMQKEWVSWAATNAIGYEYDDYHRKEIGYTDQSRIYGEVLSSIVY